MTVDLSTFAKVRALHNSTTNPGERAAAASRMKVLARKAGLTVKQAKSMLDAPKPMTQAEAAAKAFNDLFNSPDAMARRAELYDLFMALRWDRRAATGLHVFTALSRLAAGFRREDTQERSGRRSWASPARIIARRPYLRAERLKQGASS